MSANNPTTLIEFLENTGAEIRIYDMGRRVSRIARDAFLAFERTQTPYPFPMQRQAWFALVQIRSADSPEPVIWFLRLHLDEQSKLLQASRDYLIHRFVELVAESPEGATAAELGKALEDNPNTFRPRDDRMAVFHALFSHQLKRPPSHFFQHAQAYFSADKGWDQWNFVGYQGIADIAVRADDSAIAGILTSAVPQLPDEPLAALCHCLENAPLPTGLEQALLRRLRQALSAGNSAQPTLVAALLRALSRSASRDSAIQRVLEHPIAADVEILASIAGRAWESLHNPLLATSYLEALAADPITQEVFNHCVGDLLSLPGIRQPVLNVLRDPARSKALAAAFQRLITASGEP